MFCPSQKNFGMATLLCRSNHLGVERIFCPHFPKFAWKTFMRQAFSLQLRCSCCGTLYFPLLCWHWIENRIFGTWNFVLNSPTEKEGYARLCKNIVRSQMAQYAGTSAWQIWGFQLTFQLVLSARNLTPSRGRPKAVSLSEDIYAIYVACIIIFILWLCRESHNLVCSTAHIRNIQQTVWKNVLIQTR